MGQFVFYINEGKVGGAHKPIVNTINKQGQIRFERQNMA